MWFIMYGHIIVVCIILFIYVDALSLLKLFPY